MKHHAIALRPPIDFQGLSAHSVVLSTPWNHQLTVAPCVVPLVCGNEVRIAAMVRVECVSGCPPCIDVRAGDLVTAVRDELLYEALDPRVLCQCPPIMQPTLYVPPIGAFCPMTTLLFALLRRSPASGCEFFKLIIHRPAPPTAPQTMVFWPPERILLPPAALPVHPSATYQKHDDAAAQADLDAPVVLL